MSPEIRRPGPARPAAPATPSDPRGLGVGAALPRPATALLSALEGFGARPAIAWLGEESRVELSGHVLANWIIKSINHLDQEVLLEPGDLVVLDLPAHWKRFVLAVAAWSLGARVHLGQDAIPGEVRILAAETATGALAEAADEVLVLDAASLSLSCSAPLPALAHDWVREVRAHGDSLEAVLPSWGGPPVTPSQDDGSPEPGERGGPQPLVLATDGADQPAEALGALLRGRGLVGPADAVPELPTALGRGRGPASRTRS